MNMTPPDHDDRLPADARWTFLRDVMVLQIKLVLGNLMNFLLVPVSIGAALIDLVARRPRREGGRFYKVMDFAREIDENINLYSAIGGYHATGRTDGERSGSTPGSPYDGASVDNVIRRVEDVIVREYRKGGTAASVKAAVDRVLDELQRKPRK